MGASTTEKYPPASYAWYAVAVLYLAYVLSFVDRQIIAFLVGPIRADLQITDFQFSLIHGLAFVIFYALLGVPIGLLLRTASMCRCSALYGPGRPPLCWWRFRAFSL